MIVLDSAHDLKLSEANAQSVYSGDRERNAKGVSARHGEGSMWGGGMALEEGRGEERMCS